MGAVRIGNGVKNRGLGAGPQICPKVATVETSRPSLSHCIGEVVMAKQDDKAPDTMDEFSLGAHYNASQLRADTWNRRFIVLLCLFRPDQRPHGGRPYRK